MGDSDQSESKEPILDWVAIGQEFDILLAQVGAGYKTWRAVRFVLIHAFGTEKQYHYDAEFHARVALAERMLDRIAESRSFRE